MKYSPCASTCPCVLDVCICSLKAATYGNTGVLGAHVYRERSGSQVELDMMLL